MRRYIVLSLLAAFVPLVVASKAQADFVAGRDFAANELSVNELGNPNTTVPEWCYGYGLTNNGVTFNLFSGASQHTNAADGNSSLQGWINNQSGAPPATLVNTSSTTPVVLNLGSGDLFPLNPHEILMTPASSSLDSMVAWITPSSGNYTIAATWSDLDPFGGDGVSANVYLNAVSQFHQVIASTPGNEASTSYSSGTLALKEGDFIIFDVGINGDNTFDSTGFDATIQSVPEPASLVMFAMGLTCLAIWSWRRQG